MATVTEAGMAEWAGDCMADLLASDDHDALAEMAAFYQAQAARWHAIAETRLEVISNLEKTVVTFRTLAEKAIP